MTRAADGYGSGRGRRGIAALVAAGAAAGLLAACGSDSSSSSPSAGTSLSVAPNPSSFSGSPPSAFASAAASISAAAASGSAAAASFEASVSAYAAQHQERAVAALKGVEGSGNAVSDVTLTGVPLATSGGLQAAVVNIVNSTRAPASYAVQVDWRDAAGQAVVSTVVGAENVGAGQPASPVSFSRRPASDQLTPVVVKAQRY
ncbi:hypothetical protein F4556_001250 [Kitasatospora gansuensis]|uniref:Lipoprotein n=1 Tax=Kitasatospora gansuensis TaxID=258050 RepID=A0A7W7S8D1_9ACTN|nr:hypothetical protein [Kitasatospora gansuensis]MBB4945715.1 hypothetical protein [Kitasatospora gansuensis]